MKYATKNQLFIGLGVATIVMLALLFVFSGEKWKPKPSYDDEQANELSTKFYTKRLYEQLVNEELIGKGAIYFIGDSITQQFDVSKVNHSALNLGISMDTTFGILRRLDKYKYLNDARAIVLLIGINDIHRYNRAPSVIVNNYRAIFNKLPKHVPVIICDILPVDERVAYKGYNSISMQVNEEISNLASSEINIIHLKFFREFIDESGSLSKKYHNGDAVHLSDEGYNVFLREIKKMLSAVLKEKI